MVDDSDVPVDFGRDHTESEGAIRVPSPRLSPHPRHQEDPLGLANPPAELYTGQPVYVYFHHYLCLCAQFVQRYDYPERVSSGQDI